MGMSKLNEIVAIFSKTKEKPVAIIQNGTTQKRNRNGNDKLN
jgi:siroheme synthase